jgi:hypothetical protein
MDEPIITIDTNEAREIERNIIMQKTFYHPVGYHSNARLLYNDLKKQGHHFPYKTVKDWIENQSLFQIYKPRPQHIVRHSYGGCKIPNSLHQCDLLMLSHDKYKGKTYKYCLTLIDVASRYKQCYPLISKNSSEVAQAFKKIYESKDNYLIYPRLLQCDQGREFMGETSKLMRKHNVKIRLVGAYSHRKLALVERFNQTLAKMLYKIQYSVESIKPGSPQVMAWVRYLPDVINYLNNYPTRLTYKKTGL